MRLGALEIVDANFADETGIVYEIRVTTGDSAWQPLQRVSILAIAGGSTEQPAHYSLNAYLDTARGNGP
jgi:hypothetical protein